MHYLYFFWVLHVCLCYETASEIRRCNFTCMFIISVLSSHTNVWYYFWFRQQFPTECKHPEEAYSAAAQKTLPCHCPSKCDFSELSVLCTVDPCESLIWFVLSFDSFMFCHLCTHASARLLSGVVLGVGFRVRMWLCCSVADQMGFFLSQSLSIKQAISQVLRTRLTLMQRFRILVWAHRRAVVLLLCNLGET